MVNHETKEFITKKYINCPAKTGVYAADQEHVYLIDSGNRTTLYCEKITEGGGKYDLPFSD